LRPLPFGKERTKNFLINHYKAHNNGYCGEQHAVEPIQYSAVPGQNFAHILYAATALNCTFKQVAELGKD
jgi:heme/copper-type cytochrome/quinol oxidase subunit 2